MLKLTMYALVFIFHICSKWCVTFNISYRYKIDFDFFPFQKDKVV